MKGFILRSFIHLGCILSLGLAVFQAQAAFTSLYIFGDTVSTTTTGPGGALYYGNRYSNGRVWVEVLAQRQGIPYDGSKNNSYYDHESAALVTEVKSFAPTNATNALIIIWVNDADFVDILNQTTPISPPYTTAQLPLWTNVFNLLLTNHFQAITNLYAKGVRALIMPNVVDLTKVPGYAYYLNSSDELFFRQRVLAFNAAFTNTLNSAKAVCPGLAINVPDFFALLDSVELNSAFYGLTNALDSNGKSVDAVTYFNPPQSLNGTGTNFIFWDYLDPTAKVHEIMADSVQHLISPVTIGRITSLNGTNRLDLANAPVGMNGFVQASTNFVIWTSVTNFNSTIATPTLFVPVSGPLQFYRLSFSFAWTWP